MTPEPEAKTKEIFLNRAQIQAMYMNGEISLETLISVTTGLIWSKSPESAGIK